MVFRPELASTIISGSEEGQGIVAQPLDGPDRLASGQAEALEAVGCRDVVQGRERHAGPGPRIFEVVNTLVERPVAIRS
jgi:hypothetical protein